MITVNNFVYNKPLPRDFRSRINNIRQRMEAELAMEDSNKLNLKTGKGGLIDIEFVVQMLQLNYGKKYKEIRCKNTLDSIVALEKFKVIKTLHCKKLKEGYLFLKKLENLLRLLSDRSISEIYFSDFNRLSLKLEDFDDGKKLKEKYLSVTTDVRNIYNFYYKI